MLREDVVREVLTRLARGEQLDRPIPARHDPGAAKLAWRRSLAFSDHHLGLVTA